MVNGIRSSFTLTTNVPPVSIAPSVCDDFIRGGCNKNRIHVSGENYRCSVSASNASANAELSNMYCPIVPVTVNGDPHP